MTSATAGFLLMAGIAIWSWLDAVVTSRKVERLERENQQLRKSIQRCVQNCPVGREQKKMTESWKWN